MNDDRDTAGDGTLRLVPAIQSAREEAERLLDDAGLPTADLDDTVLQLALDEEGFRVGVGGVEPHPPYGLIRSLAVREDRRGEGIGTDIVRALEREARQAGLDELYLLTTDAEKFAESLGYERVDREDVPPEIRGSSQFTDTCPESATVMRKSL